MNKRTRFKISIFSGIILAILTAYSISKGTESVGVTAIAGLMTILTTYIWGETTRPSKKRKKL